MPESAIEIENNVTEIDTEIQNQKNIIRRYNTRSNIQQYNKDSDYNAFSNSKSDISNIELDLCLDYSLFYCCLSYFDNKAIYQNLHLFDQSVDMQQIQ